MGRLASLVALGAMVGTLLRASIELAFPVIVGGWPWATFLINLVGSVALGALLEYIARKGSDTGWRLYIRLGVGTGVIGGFTTYSTFVMDTVSTAQAGAFLVAFGYLASSLSLGILGAALGIVIVAKGTRGGEVR